jgi:hypothetical protein
MYILHLYNLVTAQSIDMRHASILSPLRFILQPHLLVFLLTGLDFDSKWFFESLGHDGLNKLLAGFEDKSAESVCTFAYSEGPGHEPIIFQGRTEVGISFLINQIYS